LKLGIMSHHDFWGDVEALTERIESEDASLVEIRLAPRDKNTSGDASSSSSSSQRRTRRSRRQQQQQQQQQPSAALVAIEREVVIAKIRRLADAIVAHASGCIGVTSFALARGYTSFVDMELEARILSNVHRFPNVHDVCLEEEKGGATTGSGMGGPEYAYLTLEFVAIHTCWPRTRRVALLGATVSSGESLQGGPSDVVASRLGRAAHLEEFTAPRLCVTQPARWFHQTRLVETLAGLPNLRILHLGNVGHTGLPLLGLDAMRSLARSVSLETIKLVRFGIDDACVDAFCHELLRNNNSSARLRHVEFDDFIPHISRAGCGSFWNLLRTNTSVTHLHIHCTDEEEEDEPTRSGGGPPLAVLEGDVQAMCRLNRAGRQAVQANPLGASNEDWLRLLEAASDSASASFWLLQTYPGLVSLSSRAVPIEKNATRRTPKRAGDNSVGGAKRRRLCSS
jgi:hypothetical protein